MTAAVTLALTACGATATPTSTGAAPTAAATVPGMSGMAGVATGNGLTAASSGFTFTPVTTTLPAGKPAAFQFRIQATDGQPPRSTATP